MANCTTWIAVSVSLEIVCPVPITFYPHFFHALSLAHSAPNLRGVGIQDFFKYDSASDGINSSQQSTTPFSSFAIRTIVQKFNLFCLLHVL